MSSPEDYLYPFDPTGTAVSNKIQGERQVITPANWTNFYFIVPLAAPFFEGTMVITHQPSGRVLSEGVDFYLSHRFFSASLAIGKSIYGSISIIDKTLAGFLEMNYQTLGGAWTLNGPGLAAVLANSLINPRTTTWEQVVDLPETFPVIDHEWDLDDMVGMTEVVEALEGIGNAIGATGASGLNIHLADLANPHNTTKAQVGLGSVENYAIASEAQARAGVITNAYMTPLRTAQAIATLVTAALTTHTSSLANPHQTTALQVGLGNVQDLPLASQAEAEAGTLNSRYMTPLRTAQAIAALASVSVSTHIANVANPHNTTKAQVGLGLVPNYAVADTTAAELGTATNLFMTPALVRAAIAAQTGDGLDTHIANVSNPHNTTAAQVGLGSVMNYGIATQAEAWAGSVNNRYMTPLRTAEAIAQMVGATLSGHVASTSNPHSVNKTQVGLALVENLAVATQLQAEAGAINTAYMTPIRTAQAIASLVDVGHATQTDNPHDTTAEQVGAYSKARVNEMLMDKLDTEHHATMEWVNVINDDEDPVDVRALLGDFNIDSNDFMALSANGVSNRDAIAADLAPWLYDIDNTLMTYPDASLSLASLVSPTAYLNYTFEVELDSSSTDANAMGVCAAFIRKDGRDHGIYVLRTPGGLVLESRDDTLPGGDIYKLLSVGYNLLQDDAIDLGSTNTGLRWGDGVLDADRTVDYDPVADGGWNAAGITRIRVVRSGDVLQIKTSQLGSNDVNVDGITVTVDFTSRPELEVFLGPTSYGLATFSQAGGTFKLIARPDFYQPYVVKEVDVDGVDISTINRYTGTGWASQPTKLGNVFIKPGRLYYSDWNGRLFSVQRNGALRETFLQGYLRADHVVLTP